MYVEHGVSGFAHDVRYELVWQHKSTKKVFTETRYSIGELRIERGRIKEQGHRILKDDSY
jgi:hypothetical protein